MDKRTGKCQFLLHSLGVGPEWSSAGFIQTELLQQCPGSLSALRFVDAVQGGAEAQVFESAQLVVEVALVGHDGPVKVSQGFLVLAHQAVADVAQVQPVGVGQEVLGPHQHHPVRLLRPPLRRRQDPLDVHDLGGRARREARRIPEGEVEPREKPLPACEGAVDVVAVSPFTAGSVSVTTSSTFAGSRMPMAVPS